MLRKLFTLTIGVLFVAAVVPGATFAQTPTVPAKTATAQSMSAGDSSSQNITNSPSGQLLINRAIERYQSKFNMPTTAAALRAYDLGPAGIIIAPADVKPADIQIQITPGANGKDQFTMSVPTQFRSATSSATTAPGVDQPTSNMIGVTIQSGSWSQVAGQCFSRITSSYNTWIDHCYKLSKYSNKVLSGSTYKDVYDLQHYATAGDASSIWDLDWASVSAKPTSSGMTWADWSPRSDSSGNCRSTTVGVTIEGVGISQDYTACETWTITKYTTAGQFQNKWSSGGVTGNREVAYAVEVYVPVGNWPTWTLTASVY